MRAKRSKKYRKIMEQYGLHFGFREPYQVLVDSNHLRTTHAFKMPLHRYLEKTLHGKVKAFITKCTLASILQTTDLHTSKRPDFLPPPTDLPLRHCSHADVEGEVLPEEDCLLDLLSGGVTGNQQPKNKQHFVLATADPLTEKNHTSGPSGRARRPMNASTGQDIRAYAREVPGVPIIYVKRSVMVLEELSGASLRVRRMEEKDKFREGIIGPGSRKRKRDDEDGEDGKSKDGEDGEEVDMAGPKKKKVKKVRGPNPLSVLKKKTKPKIQPPRSRTGESAVTSMPEANGSAAPDQQPKAKRRRKHGKQRVAATERAADQHDASELNDGRSDADEV